MTDVAEKDAPEAELPGMGHNSTAGLPTVDSLITVLEKDNKPALDRVAALVVKGREFLTIENDQQDSDATEYLVKLRARYKFSEADRVAAKTPFDDLAGAVQAFFKTRILDVLGRGPDNKNEEFDPVEADQYGIGPRVNMAMTLYKRRKAAAEQKRRDDEAARLRALEKAAAEKRAAEEAEKRRVEDARIAAQREAQRVEQARLDKIAADQAAERKRLADEQLALEQAAARKRSADSRAAADAAAAEAKKRADEQAAKDAADQAIRDQAKREADQRQREEDARLQADRDERDRLALEAENKLAEERAAAEEAANVKTADLSRARGGKGGVSSLKEFIDWRDLDRTKLGQADGDHTVTDPPGIVKLLPYLTDAALDKALKDYVAANKGVVEKAARTGKGQPIYGVIFFMNSKSAGRS